MSLILIFSCEIEDLNQNQENLILNIELRNDVEIINREILSKKSCKQLKELSKENIRSRKSCSLVQPNRINSQSVTHGTTSGCWASSGPCFPIRLKNAMETEIRVQNNPINDVVLTVEEIINTTNLYLVLSDVINTINIYPFISSTPANTVYDELTCQEVDEINNLPPLPNDEFYGIEISEIYCDFLLCGGPEDTWVEIYYEIINYSF